MNNEEGAQELQYGLNKFTILQSDRGWEPVELNPLHGMGELQFRRVFGGLAWELQPVAAQHDSGAAGNGKRLVILCCLAFSELLSLCIALLDYGSYQLIPKCELCRLGSDAQDEAVGSIRRSDHSYRLDEHLCGIQISLQVMQ
ncbi:hypothetical protein VTL71DRAFT_11555 [Oculimacula yallundae]|uniref:Uncharacterized protein n=1 Tax=Oculimacula yallundae TaxID=86028 RepID=A0ABR4CRL2_9HELO